MNVVKPEHWYIVAVWWPKDGGYGGFARFGSLEETATEVEELKRLHYGTPSNPIHVIKQTADVIVRVVDSEKPEDLPRKKRK